MSDTVAGGFVAEYTIDASGFEAGANQIEAATKRIEQAAEESAGRAANATEQSEKKRKKRRRESASDAQAAETEVAQAAEQAEQRATNSTERAESRRRQSRQNTAQQSATTEAASTRAAQQSAAERVRASERERRDRLRIEEARRREQQRAQLAQTRAEERERKKKQREEEKKKKEEAAALKERTRRFNEAGQEAASAIAMPLKMLAASIIGGGILAFTADVTKSAAAIGRLSSNIGVGIQDLQTWDMAAQRAGIQSGEMTQQMRDAAADLARLKSGMGMSEQLAEFMRRGGNQNDLKDAESLMMGRARVLSQISKQDPTKALAIADAMGVGSLIDILKQGPAAIETLIAAQRKNAVVTEESAKKAAELEAKWLDIKNKAVAGLTEAVIKAWPYIEKFADKFSAKMDELGRWIDENRSTINFWIDTFSRAFDMAADSVGWLVDAVGGLDKAIGLLLGWKVAAWLVGLTAPAAGATAAVGGIAAAVATLKAGLMSLLPILGVVGAAVAGWQAGSWLYEKMPEDSKEAVGEMVTRTLAFFGNDEAKYALESKERQRAGLPPLPTPAITTPSEKPSYTPIDAATKQQKFAPAAKGEAAKNQADAVEYFVSKGWSKEQAAGIVANLASESGQSLNPRAFNPAGGRFGAIGVAQWRGERIINFKKVTGKDLRESTREEQLAFVDWELRNTEKRSGEKLKRARTPEEAAMVISSQYERHSDGIQEHSKRMALAGKINAQTIPANDAQRVRTPTETTALAASEKPPIQPGAMSAMQPTIGATTAPSVVAAGATTGGNTANASANVSIGQITVNAGQNANAAEVARSIAPEIKGTLGAASLDAMRATQSSGTFG